MSRKDDVTIDQAYAYLVLRTARLLRFHFQRMTARLGMDISPEQWLLLNRLAQTDGQSQTELTDSTFKDRPNLSRMLASLEKKGFVRREADPSDLRQYRVFLRAEGRKAHERLMKSVAQERAKVYRNLRTEDFQALRRILDILDKNLLNSLGFAPDAEESS